MTQQLLTNFVFLLFLTFKEHHKRYENFGIKLDLEEARQYLQNPCKMIWFGARIFERPPSSLQFGPSSAVSGEVPFSMEVQLCTARGSAFSKLELTLEFPPS